MVPTEKTAGELDARRSLHVIVLGRKYTGKTELAYHLWSTYPYDGMVIDPNGDIAVDDDVEDLAGPIPSRWPSWPAEELGHKPKRRRLHYVPDFTDPAYADEIDRAVGLAFAHPRTGLLVDEAHEAFPAALMEKRPHARRALRHSRHRQLTMILATPRALTIDPLCISQADMGYFFKLPQRSDRQRVAENIGWDPRVFDEANQALGDHEYLRWTAADDDLAHMPALPAHLIRHHAPH